MKLREFAVSFNAKYKRQKDKPLVYMIKVKAENPYDALILVKEIAGFKIDIRALLELPSLKSHIKRDEVSYEYECLRLLNVIQYRKLDTEGKMLIHY